MATQAKSTRLFVYGSLRKGGEDHEELEGSEYEGETATAPNYEKKPLKGATGLVGGDAQVKGELYKVAPKKLAKLDELEANYRRGSVRLEDGTSADAYLAKSASKRPVLKRLKDMNLPDRIDPIFDQWQMYQRQAEGGEKEAEAAPAGWYKGQPTSPATVKFKTEFQGIPISVDRPKGFIMVGKDAKGNDWARRYKFDYGFIPKTLGGDNDGLDVFIGPEKKAPYAYWVIQRKDDGTFDEYKIFLGFPDRDAATAAYRQHIPKKYFKGVITIKVEMMKAMLGKVNPDENIKRASALGFIDELGWLLRTST